MKFAYFGYRDWAENILENLPDKFDIDSFTVENNQYENLQGLGTKVINRKEIDKLDLDNYRALLFYGWSWLIPDEIVNNRECVCLHPSPLPKYRGGSPLQHQILAGEKQSAVSIFRMDDGIDTGPVYYQGDFSLEGTIGDIFQRISKVGTSLTTKLLMDFQSGKAKSFPQDHSQATFYKRRKPHESELNQEMISKMNSEEIYNFVRSLGDPYPNAYIVGKDGKKVYLKQADLESEI